jgi:hypothetical protein
MPAQIPSPQIKYPTIDPVDLVDLRMGLSALAFFASLVPSSGTGVGCLLEAEPPERKMPPFPHGVYCTVPHPRKAQHAVHIRFALIHMYVHT